MTTTTTVGGGGPAAIPAPRRPAEQHHRTPTPSAPPTASTASTASPASSGIRAVCEEPGWVTLVEALDQTVAGIVAHLEHRLCRADPATAARLRHQLTRARRLEATTAAAAAAAQRRDHHPIRPEHRNLT